MECSVIPKGEVKKKQIYSQEEMAHLLTAIQGEPLKYKAFFFLIAYSGWDKKMYCNYMWHMIQLPHRYPSKKRTGVRYYELSQSCNT